ncbi:MAG: MFS transporter [Saccharospirillum sp.]|nr:MFS transporter [Saccharospirillum sp.]
MAFNSLEKKALSGLAVLYASRMLGLFMVLPVLAVSGQSLTGATAQTLGIALGIYGATQAMLQLPLGALSDRYGRKPVMLAGLLVFLLGSVVAALAEHVLVLILGRALQGAGAIAAVILALLADYTREAERTKAMAVIGATIGASFVVAVMVGPVLAQWGGLSAVFWATAALALVSMVVVLRLPVPPPARRHADRRWRSEHLQRILFSWHLMPLTLGVFVLHLVLVALFVGLPLQLQSLGLSDDQLSWVYAPIMIFAFIGMLPLIIMAERNKAHRFFMSLAALMIAVAAIGMGLNDRLLMTLGLIWLFFVGFNLLEATLPSLVSRYAPTSARGTAMGIFSTGQFLGAAVGGVVGGWLYAHYQMEGIAWLSGLLMLAWIALFQGARSKVREWVVPAALADDNLLQQRVEQLEKLEGVYQARFEKQSNQVVWSVVARPNALDQESLEAQLR